MATVKISTENNQIVFTDVDDSNKPYPYNQSGIQARYSDTQVWFENLYGEPNLFPFLEANGTKVEKYLFTEVQNSSGVALNTKAAVQTYLSDKMGVSSSGGSSSAVKSPIDRALGNIVGEATHQISGFNPSVGNVFEDIWGGGVLSTLNYDAQTANFTAGLLLTGGTSAATAIIVIDDDSGATGTLTIRKITGTFQDGEAITDSSTGSADADGTVSPVLSMIYPTSGETWEAICESTDDDVTGTGARTMLVSYLDDAYVAQTEIVNLDGLTASTFTATDSFRFNGGVVVSWGSATIAVFGKTNLGTIIIRNSVSKQIRGIIRYDDSVAGDEHGLNNALNSHYTVPAGQTAVPEFILSNVTKNHDVTLRSLIRPFGSDGFVTAAELGNYQNTTVQDVSPAPVSVPEKSDIKFIARSNNTAVGVTIQVGLTIIDN